MFQTNDEVITPYGPGQVLDVREEDGIYVIQLPNATKAYMPASQLRAKRKLFEMSDEEKLEASKTYREQGNMFFKFGDYALALTKYELAKVYLKHSSTIAEEHLHGLLNNIALTLSKSNLHSDSIAACGEALKLTNKSAAAESKTLYLRAQAQRKMGNLDSAVEDLVLAQKLQPRSKAIAEEMASAKNEAKRARETQAALFKDAFKKPASPAAAPLIAEKAAPTLAEPAPKKQEQAPPAPANAEPQQDSFFSSPTFMVGVAATCLLVMFWARGG